VKKGGCRNSLWFCRLVSRQSFRPIGRVESVVRHFACNLQRRPVLPGVIGLVFSIRHGRSPPSAPATGSDIWSQWRGTELVQQLLGRKTTTSTSWLADFGFVHDSLWCTTVIGPRTDFFSCCIPSTCHRWLTIAAYRRTYMLMILSYMGFAHRPKVLTSRCAFLAVLMTSRLGCAAVGYEILTRRSSSVWLSSSRRVHQIPQQPLRVGSDVVTPVSVVWDLDIYLDSDMSMRSHVGKTVSSCFAILRHIQSIRRLVSRHVLQSMVVSLVLSRLDFGNATLKAWQAYVLQRPQSVMNAAARLIFSSSRFDHISPLLSRLHWLKAESITYKVTALVYKYQHGPYGANVPVWRGPTSTCRHSIHTTSTFCLINVSGCPTYSSVHCRRQSVSCRSRSSVEQSSIARHCSPSLLLLLSS